MPHKHSRNFSEFVDFIKSRGFNPGTVIDVGVHYGTSELQGGFPDAYHILIEPLQELEQRMKAILGKVKGEYHLVACSSQAGIMEIFVPDSTAGATLISELGHEKNRKIPVETLDLLCSNRELARPILLKTDTQGFDLEVVKGGVELLKDIEVVVMEVNMFRPRGRTNLPDFGEIVCWMRDHNFSVYDIISYQQRPFDGALGYVDLAFVKSDGSLRKHHRWA